MAGMDVRRIHADEGLQLRDVRLRALADAPEAFIVTLAEAQAWPAAAWHELAAHGAAGAAQAIFIAVDGNNDGEHWLGMVSASLEADDAQTANLVEMWISPAARRRGVGQALVDVVVAWAQERRVHRLQLWVNQANTDAVALYRRLGFRATGRTAQHPADPSRTGMLMVRAL